MAEGGLKQTSSQEDQAPPVFPLVGSKIEPQIQLLKQHFITKFNQPPSFYVRVPGRVNLIGEHVDYCGYSVCPMALQNAIIIAVKSNNNGTLELTNLDPQFEDHTCSITSMKIEKEGIPKWHNYIFCGVIGVQEVLNGATPVGMCMAVTGDIPPNSGLSSSSALVSAAALATAHTNEFSMSKLSIAKLCADCERYIGTQGGGMDQAIGFLGTKGCAKHIMFNPLRCENVTLPDGAVFVIAHSLAEHNKAAHSDFNCRVAECRLATQVLAKHSGLQWETITRLADLQTSLQKNLDEMIALVNKVLHDEPYTKNEICSNLEISSDKLMDGPLSKIASSYDKFKIKQRALHVYQEAKRVEMFCAICAEPTNSDSLKKLGDLLHQSHISLQHLYECSHPELDRLVELGDKVALGSRLTGAGWGGCAVALTTHDTANQYIKLLKESFYKDNPACVGKNIDKLLFATEPYDGAAVYLV